MEVNSRRRLLVIGAIVVALFGGLLTRLWFLQVTGGETLAVAAQRNASRFVQVPAVRGTIYDDKGNVLAQTIPVTTLTVDRQNLTAADRVTLETNLGRLLAIDAKAVDARIDNNRYDPFVPVPVAENVPLEQAVYVAEHRDQFPQVDVTRSAERVYPQGTLGANLLGYVGQVNADELKAHAQDGYTAEDSIGKTGIEQTFESELRGVPGRDKVVVDSQGRAVNTIEVKKPQAGHDVQLTVDLDAQRIAEESLQQGMDGARTLVDPDSGNYYKANAGAVVVLDARTGSVVAMASNPTYNPNDFIAGNADGYFNDPNKPLIDRALNPYAPGSTFKLFSSIAMLQSGLRSADETFYDEGCFKFGGEGEQSCNAGKVSHGYVDLRRAITVSSDVYFYNVGNSFWNAYRDEGQHAGAHGDLAGDAVPDSGHPVGDAMQHVARDYGFGASTGIGLAGDQAGVVPDHAYRVALNKGNPDQQFWRRGDSANLAVGQGDVLVTPLQLANGYATFANNGTLYMPRLVSAVHASSVGLPDKTLGPVLHTIDPQVKAKTGLTPETRGPIYDGLAGVVSDGEGTAYGSFRDYQGIKVIGKTGTAQVHNGQDTSWFVAITNPDNDPAVPQYVVVSMVEQGGFGANVSAPIVRRVIDYLYNPTQGPPPPVSVAPATGNEQSF